LSSPCITGSYTAYEPVIHGEGFCKLYQHTYLVMRLFNCSDSPRLFRDIACENARACLLVVELPGLRKTMDYHSMWHLLCFLQWTRCFPPCYHNVVLQFVLMKSIGDWNHTFEHYCQIINLHHAFGIHRILWNAYQPCQKTINVGFVIQYIGLLSVNHLLWRPAGRKVGRTSATIILFSARKLACACISTKDKRLCRFKGFSLFSCWTIVVKELQFKQVSYLLWYFVLGLVRAFKGCRERLQIGLLIHRWRSTATAIKGTRHN